MRRSRKRDTRVETEAQVWGEVMRRELLVGRGII
jgi:hypothetical protein